MVCNVLVHEEYFRDSISVIIIMYLEILVDNDDIQFYVHNQSSIDDGKYGETNCVPQEINANGICIWMKQDWR